MQISFNEYEREESPFLPTDVRSAVLLSKDPFFQGTLSCQKIQAHPTTSSCLYKIEGFSLRSACIGFINGMNTDLDKAIRYASHIQQFTKEPIPWEIEGVYNATHKIAVDLLESGINLAGYSPYTADLLCARWQRFHDANRDILEAKYLQICHSQGAMHVTNALKKAPLEIQKRILVLAIAPTCEIESDLCFRVHSYVSKNDVTRKLPSHATLLEPKGKELNDHNFNSETFHDVLASHITKYILTSPGP